MSNECTGSPEECNRMARELRDVECRLFFIEDRLEALKVAYDNRETDYLWIEQAVNLLRELASERDARLIAIGKWQQRLAAQPLATEEQR